MAAGCAAKDYKCFCAKQVAYQAEATKCVADGCGADAVKVKPLADAVCACAGKA